ncbi:hypothetical protein EFY87_15735 [Flexivirga caeni]|uniref:Rhodanese domain-containing protein n=2 Tax=Flexivirga caeni TaxID=2294115 RepID=A0A3M9M2W7_9MICO|nr:hypothetical protein EFY87_15735 [Flexivirga caeni]
MTWQSELFASLSTPLHGMSPRAAFQEALWGRATLVDIRPQAQRMAFGCLPDAVSPRAVDRTALAWRLDPASDDRLPIAARDLRVVVVCQEGHISSRAAETLVRLGVRHATGMAGGFAAWQALGLPVAA